MILVGVISCMALSLAAHACRGHTPKRQGASEVVHGCASVNSEGKCLSCYPNYLPNSKTDITLCSLNPLAFCKTAITNMCTSCIAGYTYTGALCTTIVPNCLHMNTSTNQCNMCLEGYLPLNVYPTAECVKCTGHCPSFCVNFTDGTCQGCAATYYFSNGTCAALPIGCYSGNEHGCFSCLPGYVPNSTINKTHPVTFCFRCNIFYCIMVHDGVCVACAEGFSLTVTGTCVNTLPHCVIYSNQRCQKCEPNYLPSCTMGMSMCAHCNGTCPTNCMFLDINGKCTQCSQGYYPHSFKNESTVCMPLPEGCMQANSIGQCYNCDVGYLPDSLVISSIANFQHCYPCKISFCIVASGPGVCSVCKLGFVLINGSCIESVANCAAFNTSVCVSCKIGYLPSNPFFIDQCIQCNGGCVENCASVSADGICTGCPPGFYFTGEACLPLPRGCAIGYPNGSCTECASGFVPIEHNMTSCTVAPLPFCSRADAAGACMQCNAGYILQKNATEQACIPGVQNCQSFDFFGTCASCIPGYLPISIPITECVRCTEGLCTQNCQLLSTSESGVCVACSQGYYFTSEGKCAVALPGCVVSTIAGACIQCGPNYVANDVNNITECIWTNVTRCAAWSSGRCTKCFEGFELRGQTCEPMQHDDGGLVLTGGFVAAMVICIVLTLVLCAVVGTILVRRMTKVVKPPVSASGSNLLTTQTLTKGPLFVTP